MSKVDRFEDLDCWKKSRELVNVIFDICENQKFNKNFSTQDQLKRAAISTMNNISEGFGRYSNKEFIRFFRIFSFFFHGSEKYALYFVRQKIY